MREGYLLSGNYKIHYVAWGDVGPKILLIHSMGMDGHSMDKLGESLQNKYQVLSLTILDHGDSDSPKQPIGLTDHAEIMRDCYTQIDFIPNLLIGHSVGGMMGMILASKYPDEFMGLVLVDIAPFELTGRPIRPPPPDSFKDEAEAKAWLKERYPLFTEYYYQNRLSYAFKKEEGVLKLKPRGDKLRSGLAVDLWPYVENIITPTLLLIGEESTLVTTETRKRMEESMLDLEVVVVENTSHMIPQDVPEEFEKLIKNFLKNI